jgi:hypothetical protein
MDQQCSWYDNVLIGAVVEDKGRNPTAHNTAYLLRPEHRPWPSANAWRLKKMCHAGLRPSVTYSNAKHFE